MNGVAELHYFLPDEAATEVLGYGLAARLDAPFRLHLEGELGAGKSSLARAIIRALGHSGLVPSPTYTLVEPYEDCRPPVFHMDLYRLADPEELEFLGIRELDSEPAVWLVEWPERGAGVLPPAQLKVQLSREGDGRRAVLRLDATEGGSFREQLLADESLKEYAVSC